MTDSKLMSSSSPDFLKGVAPTGANKGGGETQYIKKSATAATPNTDSGRFNPMHAGKSTFGLGEGGKTG
jgi:hypothetical protein